ncbi:MAG: phospho-N-acetylmuramoyl-pentapeptide-transferase [Hominimerdicola sp.]
MLYNILNKLGMNLKMTGLMTFAVLITAFLLSFFVLKYFKKILPKDQGRAFAVNGALSEGKPRGAGLLFITTFTLSIALFYPLSVENLLYLIFIYGAMLSGYFDDAAETPWGNLKKGLIDLVIALGSSFVYYHYNGSTIKMPLFGVHSLTINPVLFVILGAVLVWTAINVTNCTDGVDGLCSSLVLVTTFSLLSLSTNKDSIMVLAMAGTLLGYLWFNCSPSQMLMGDAGSRALGVFLAIMFLKSGCPIAFIPLAFVIIIDGGLGLLKLSFRRFLKIKNFMEGIRTPIHDHMRKNKGWSDTQVVIRFTVLQIVINLCYLGLAH